MLARDILSRSARCGSSLYREATRLFFLGAAAAFLAPGHGPCQPYPRKGSVWVTHMLPRLLGPGAPCHSHGACAPAPPSVFCAAARVADEQNA